MTPVEKWNAFSAYADPIVALAILCVGVGLIVARKKLAASRVERITRGEISTEAAAKNEKLVHWGSLFLTGSGTLLLLMWIFGS